MVKKIRELEKTHKGIFLELDYGRDVKIDLKDKKILSILGENCRTTSMNIGRSAHMSKDSVRYRIKQLIDKDIYRGNTTIINPFVLGFPVYAILIKIKNISLEEQDKMLDFLENHPFIIWIGETQGTYDYHIDITAKDITHFDKLLKEIQLKFSSNLKELKVLHITKIYGTNTLPLEFQREFKTAPIKDKRDSSFSLLLKEPLASTEQEVIKPSMKEILILKEISNNANLTLQEISEKTKIKPNTVKNTIKNLIRKNIILAFRGMINVSFLKYHGYIIYFKLALDVKQEKRKEFENYLRQSVHLSFGAELSGSYYDSMVYVFAKNPLEFNALINDIRNKFSDIIEEYDTDLILKDYKFTFFPRGLLGTIQSAIVKVGAKF